MSGQLIYGYQPPQGIAGGLYDLSPHLIDTRVNGENTAAALKFGMGVMRGSTPGVNILLPTSSNTADEFEGLLMTGFTHEINMAGEVLIYPLQTVGVMCWGRPWARVVNGVTPAYGDALYLVTSGADAGLFTNVASGNLAINGRFIGGLGVGDIAPVELYKQK